MKRATLVVDASVVVEWVLPGPEHEPAVRVLKLYLAEELDLIAPHLVVSETSNAIWKRVERRELGIEEARQCFEVFLSNCPILLDSPSVSRSALELALAHRQAVYDCLYLAWALDQRCDLITLDRKMFRALGTAYSCVQLLEHFHS